MKNYVIFSFSLLILISCNNQTPNSKQLINVDVEFSKYSEENGVNKAFAKYAHDSAVLLRENSYPILGRSNIIDIFSQPDTSFSLTWEPSYANISKSTDLGYTYGIYTFSTADTTTYGTYVSIWINTSNGWKYILDTGNSGLSK